ncbi:putative T7SS-secreted protein [Rhodococcus sp. NPDC055112]
MSWLSDTWDDATGAIDSAGEFVEDAVESGIESLGQAADSGLDAASGVARRLGADGVADALTDLGDQVASLTGGAVDELELGQTEQPKELIRGEPAAIAEATTTLNELSSSIGSTGDALRTIDAAGWTGTAADGFNAVYDKQPGLWHEAADAMSAAGRSLTSWSYTVEAAQARAAEAVELWRQAEREELARKTAYAALGADGQAGTELVDSWSAMKDGARELLRGARIERDGVAGQVAGALSQATAAAPTEPPFTERMVANLADATDALEVAKTNFGAGLLTGLTGIVQFVRQVNPTDQYNLTHPAEYGAAMSDLATGLFVAAADPGAVVSAMLDDALNNPFEFAGSLTGDAILTAATAGAGGGVAAARSVERMVDAAGDFAGPARLADTVADAGRHVPTPEVPPAGMSDVVAPEASRAESHSIEVTEPASTSHNEVLTQEVHDRIVDLEKGERPDPSEYLSPDYIEHHLAQFDDGATRFVTENNLEKYGIAQRDGTAFVMPNAEADALIGTSGGDPRALEDALGLPEGFLDSNQLVRVDIADPGELNVRVPSGNEAGANELWIPGGKLPNGNLEAVIDAGNIDKDQYSTTKLESKGVN